MTGMKSAFLIVTFYVILVPAQNECILCMIPMPPTGSALIPYTATFCIDGKTPNLIAKVVRLATFFLLTAMTLHLLQYQVLGFLQTRAGDRADRLRIEQLERALSAKRSEATMLSAKLKQIEQYKVMFGLACVCKLI